MTVNISNIMQKYWQNIFCEVEMLTKIQILKIKIVYYLMRKRCCTSLVGRLVLFKFLPHGNEIAFSLLLRKDISACRWMLYWGRCHPGYLWSLTSHRSGEHCRWSGANSFASTLNCAPTSLLCKAYSVSISMKSFKSYLVRPVSLHHL